MLRNLILILALAANLSQVCDKGKLLLYLRNFTYSVLKTFPCAATESFGLHR